MMVLVRETLVAIQLEHAAAAPEERPLAFVRLAVQVLDAEADHGSPAIAVAVHAEASAVAAGFVECEADVRERVAVVELVAEEAAVAEEFEQAEAALEVVVLVPVPKRALQHQACRASLDSACRCLKRQAV